MICIWIGLSARPDEWGVRPYLRRSPGTLYFDWLGVRTNLSWHDLPLPKRLRGRER